MDIAFPSSSDSPDFATALRAQLRPSRSLISSQAAEEAVFCVLDAARDDVIYKELYQRQASIIVQSLYQGDLAEDLAEVAPYLVALEPESEFFQWLIEKGWGESWGIFCKGPISFREVRNHFRKLAFVQTEDGETLLFRYYDPRVLRIFLPTCDGEQLGQIFGAFSCFYTESDTGEELLTFRLRGGGLTCERTNLSL